MYTLASKFGANVYISLQFTLATTYIMDYKIQSGHENLIAVLRITLSGLVFIWVSHGPTIQSLAYMGKANLETPEKTWKDIKRHESSRKDTEISEKI